MQARFQVSLNKLQLYALFAAAEAIQRTADNFDNFPSPADLGELRSAQRILWSAFELAT